MKQTISKDLFLHAAVCPTLGWRLRADLPGDRATSAPVTPGEQFWMEQGAEIGRMARGLFPSGVLVSSRNVADAAAQTQQYMQSGGPHVLFEAAFVVDEYAAKADVLIRQGDTWRLIEVKSSVNPRPELVDDLAYTLLVLSKAGLTISSASLLLVSKDYRFGMEDAKLFVEHDCTKEAQARAGEFQAFWDSVRSATRATSMPAPALIPACKGCVIFSDCLGKGIDHHILEIPRLGAKKVDELKGLGVYRIEQIPQTFDLTPIQARVRQAVITGQPWVGPDLKQRLRGIVWPAHYLDFETMSTALPLYPGTAPYTQIPVQYSIDRCTAVGEIVSHAEYIGNPMHDNRRDLAQRLIHDLQGRGSIVAYSTFEKTTINGLAALFPDLAGELSALTQRIFDLEAVLRESYYHPAFHGKTSVKSTLPALLPGMSYATLNIKDGGSASATFAYMAQGRYTSQQIESLKKDLLAYCGQDTLAMVKLHQRLVAA